MYNSLSASKPGPGVGNSVDVPTMSNIVDQLRAHVAHAQILRSIADELALSIGGYEKTAENGVAAGATVSNCLLSELGSISSSLYYEMHSVNAALDGLRVLLLP